MQRIFHGKIGGACFACHIRIARGIDGDGPGFGVAITAQRQHVKNGGSICCNMRDECFVVALRGRCGCKEAGDIHRAIARDCDAVGDVSRGAAYVSGIRDGGSCCSRRGCLIAALRLVASEQRRGYEYKRYEQENPIFDGRPPES
jgi:hypothetical protein